MVMKAIVISIVLFAAAGAFGQKAVPSFPDNASLEQTAAWFIANFERAARYKTSSREYKVSGVRFADCKLRYASTTRFSGESQDSVRVTVRQATVKRDVAIDLAALDAASVILADHLQPELRILRISRLRAGSEPVEITIRGDAADAIRSAFFRAITLCKPK